MTMLPYFCQVGKKILLASSVLCSVNPSLQVFLAPCPICLIDHFWTLGTFESLRCTLFCVATHLWHGHNWSQVSNPISPGDQTEFYPGTQLNCISNLSRAFFNAKLYCLWQEKHDKKSMARKALCNVRQSPRCPGIISQKPKQQLSVMYMQSVLYTWYYGLCC